jgi:hypothetical protein
MSPRAGKYKRQSRVSSYTHSQRFASQTHKSSDFRNRDLYYLNLLRYVMYSTALLLSLVGPLVSAAAVKRQNLDITVSYRFGLSHAKLTCSHTTEVPSPGPIPLDEVSPLLMPPMHHAVVNPQVPGLITH